MDWQASDAPPGEYMDEKQLEQAILDTLKRHSIKKFRRRELYSMIGDKSVDYPYFKTVLTQMEKAGRVVRTKGRLISLPTPSKIMTGIFNASRNGGGSVRFPDGESVFVRPNDVGDAFSGDTVQVTMKKRHRTGYAPTAKITAVIERSTTPVIGIIEKHGKTVYVVPRGDGFPHNILVKNPNEFEYDSGNMVVCRIEVPEVGYSRPMCVMTDVLGDPFAPGVDVLAIARRYDLSLEFSDEVIRESEVVPEDLGPEVLSNRRDIRNVVTFTIDPDDAKDFDDAISISRKPDGGYELGVHIADVSHYVKPESAMDLEAINRGMSCYLVDRVIPMLPERLSNNLCSLNSHVDRLTKSIFMSIDSKGNVLSYEGANTVIHSDMRLTYHQVQDYLDGKRSDGAGEIKPEVGDALKMFSELADILIARRSERGAVDMELPEAKVILDERGVPVNIIKRDRVKAHRMIEEAMLLANTITARMLAAKDVPFLYRIHDKPDKERIKAFAEMANMLGYEFNADSALGDQHYIHDFLDSIRDSDYAHVLNFMLLRSMKKAAYSPKNIGHYGLALDEYAHFTSPIRRYPDLVVHRQLDACVFGVGRGQDGNGDFSYYEQLGSHVTAREIISDSAERDSIKMKTAEFMSSHVGEEFNGTITGVMPNGFFVEIETYFVEGLVHVSTLDDDYYSVDHSGVAIVGKGSGRRFTVGDKLRVQVVSANKERGEIDFMVVNKSKKSKSGNSVKNNNVKKKKKSRSKTKTKRK